MLRSETVKFDESDVFSIGQDLGRFIGKVLEGIGQS